MKMLFLAAMVVRLVVACLLDARLLGEGMILPCACGWRGGKRKGEMNACAGSHMDKTTQSLSC